MSSTQSRHHLLIELRHLATLRKQRLHRFGCRDNVATRLLDLINNRQLRLEAYGV